MCELGAAAARAPSDRQVDEGTSSRNLAEVDRTVGSLIIAAVVAFLIAVVLAHDQPAPGECSLSKANGKSPRATSRSNPRLGRGARSASRSTTWFEDLAVTRRRLAPASRIAAWREVAPPRRTR